MLTNFKVHCDFQRGWTSYVFNSKVYAIDALKERFLVADWDGNFHWVDMDDCTLEEE